MGCAEEGIAALRDGLGEFFSRAAEGRWAA